MSMNRQKKRRSVGWSSEMERGGWASSPRRARWSLRYLHEGAPFRLPLAGLGVSFKPQPSDLGWSSEMERGGWASSPRRARWSLRYLHEGAPFRLPLAGLGFSFKPQPSVAAPCRGGGGALGRGRGHARSPSHP